MGGCKKMMMMMMMGLKMKMMGKFIIAVCMSTEF